MKSTYHIIIDKEDKDKLEDILTSFGTDISAKVVTTLEDNNTVIDYIVTLSKYELLYIRLACNSGKIKDITNRTPEVL